MFLTDLWYFGATGRTLKPGQLRHKVMLGQPVLIGRAHDGKAFAMQDTCPHRGILLSSGKMLQAEDGESRVECPYHGWQFGPDASCRHIPSLVDGQELDPTKIQNRSYPCKEVNGNIWVYVAEDPRRAGEPVCEPPVIPDIENAQPQLIETATFNCAIDHAVIGLMDPAHGPFVHGSWWWRSSKSAHEKAKSFGPAHLGFAMRTHKPSSNSSLYKFLGGDVTTEISFQIPGIRIEHIKAGKHTMVGLTTVTPITEGQTEVTQTFYWNMPWLGPLKPLLRVPVQIFLRQDRDAVNEQQKGLKFDPRLMLIDDADQQAKWYHRLKKEWTDSRQEGREFTNPVPETVLRWRS
jgi:phenylpropionate dioxygenase-like ring-hydroxylating dioxygenase large terminal subunit